MAAHSHTWKLNKNFTQQLQGRIFESVKNVCFHRPICCLGYHLLLPLFVKNVANVNNINRKKWQNYQLGFTSQFQPSYHPLDLASQLWSSNHPLLLYCRYNHIRCHDFVSAIQNHSCTNNVLEFLQVHRPSHVRVSPYPLVATLVASCIAMICWLIRT